MKKANGVFVQLYPVWRNHNIAKGVKIRIFNTNVKSVLLYACETWKTINQIRRRLQTFTNKCLRRIMNINRPIRLQTLENYQIEAKRNLYKKKKMELD
jgi:hypothetical protein